MAALLVLSLLFPVMVWAQPPKRDRALSLRFADAVLIAKLEKATLVGIAYSLPPKYGSQLRITPSHVSRGAFKKGKTVDVWHNVTQTEKPKFPVGKECIVALEYLPTQNAWTVMFIEEATKESIKEAKAATKKGK
jgi:hypothetical protein